MGMAAELKLSAKIIAIIAMTQDFAMAIYIHVKRNLR